MSEQGPQEGPHDRPGVMRVMLPNGRSIEVYRGPEQNNDLHVCPECDSHLVQPKSWSENNNSDRTWRLTLDCPNCFWTEEDDFTQAQVYGLEDELDKGFEDLFDTLEQLTRANLAGEIIRFAEALENDHILPEDF